MKWCLEMSAAHLAAPCSLRRGVAVTDPRRHRTIDWPTGAAPRQHQPACTRQSTVCMAEPRRVARVNKQLEREIGSLLLFDKVLQKAVCPEKRRGMDAAESAIASVTEVRITSDLQVARVYISIFSDPVGKQTAMEELARLQPYVRKKIGSNMSLRLTPEIRFIYDESHDRGERVLKLLKQIKMQESGEVEAPPIAVPARQLDPQDAVGSTDDSEAAGRKEDSGSDSEDASDEEDVFFDDGADTEVAVASSNTRSGQRSGLSRHPYEPEMDTSFFGFQDPGNTWNDDLEELAWREEEDLQRGTDIDTWTGGSRAEGSSEALEPIVASKESKGSKRCK